MNDSDLFNQVFICALETVGFTQFLKQSARSFGVKSYPPALWTVVMAALAIGFTLGYDFLPQWITGAILVIVVSQLFYDTVFQALQHIVAALAAKGEAIVSHTAETKDA
jgi:hypothetical protein